MDANFAAILGMQADAAKAPPQMPVGGFDFVVKKHEFGESSQKKTPYVRFIVSPTTPHEDVDEEELGAVENWRTKEFRIDRYLTPDAVFMLTGLLRDTFNLDVDGKSFEELIPEATNAVFMGALVQVMAGQGNNQRPITVLDDNNLAPAE